MNFLIRASSSVVMAGIDSGGSIVGSRFFLRGGKGKVHVEAREEWETG